jgi:hypothetical protein
MAPIARKERGRPWGGGKIAGYRRALRVGPFVAAVPIRVMRGCFQLALSESQKNPGHPRNCRFTILE